MYTYLKLSPQHTPAGNNVPANNEPEPSALADQRHLLLGQQQQQDGDLNIVSWMQGVDYRLLQIENCIANLVQQQQQSAGWLPATSHAASSSPAPPVNQAFQIRRRDLEAVLGPLFRRQPSPTAVELGSVTRTLEHLYPDLERRPILSQVRKWFRKRREELGQKVFSQAQARWGQSPLEVDRLLRDLRHDQATLTQILHGCGMDLEVNEACLTMIYTKVSSFLTRRKTARQLSSDED